MICLEDKMPTIEEIRTKLIQENVVPPDTHDQHITNLLLALARNIPFAYLLDITRIYRGYRDAGKDSDGAAGSAMLQWIGSLRQQDGLGEAPAWVSFKYDREGFYITQTLRAFTDEEVEARLDVCIKRLQKQGVATATVAPVATMMIVPECPEHKMPMKESKFGGYYCPQKIGEHPQTGDAMYCTHKSD